MLLPYRVRTWNCHLVCIYVMAHRYVIISMQLADLGRMSEYIFAMRLAWFERRL